MNKLGELCEIGSATRIFADEYVENGVPFFRSKETIELSEGKLFVSEPLYISKKRFDEIKKEKPTPKRNDILLSAVGAYLGVPYLVDVDYEFYFKDGNIIWLRSFSKKIVPSYLYWLLKSDIFQKQFHSKSIGAAQKALTIDSLKQYEVNLPDIDTQKQISSLLNSLNKKININNQINSELESMTKTIYDYWFLQFEFPNEEGKPYKSSGGKMVWNEELKRKIPEEWEVKPLSEIVVEKEKSKTQVGDVSGIGKYPFFTSGESVLKSDKHIVDGANCYLSTGGNASLKFFVGEADYSTDTWCISANRNHEFMLYMYLKSILPMMDTKFFQGTGLKHLQKPLLLREMVAVPNEVILAKFNNMVKASFELISKNYNENQELASLRDFLLPMLMNGQVTFKSEE